MYKFIGNDKSIILQNKNGFSANIFVGLFAGSRFDPRGIEGIAHFTEHLVGEIVAKPSKDDDSFRHVSEIDAQTSREIAYFWVRTSPDFLSKAKEATTRIFEENQLRQVTFEREKNAIIGAQRAVLDPYDYLFELAFKTLYSGHPLSTQEVGTASGVCSITLDDCQKFFEKNYLGKKPMLVACGNVPIDFFDGLDLPQGDVRLNYSEVLPPYTAQNVFEEINLPNSEICLATRLDVPQRPPVEVLDLLNFILGGSSNSRLFRVLREQHGIAYDTRSIINHYTDTSNLLLYCGLSNKHDKEQALNIINQTLERFTQTLTKVEFALYVESFLARFLMDFEKPELAARKTLYYSMITGKPFNYANYLNTLRSIRLTELKDAAGMAFSKEQLSLIVLE